MSWNNRGNVELPHGAKWMLCCYAWSKEDKLRVLLKCQLKNVQGRFNWAWDNSYLKRCQYSLLRTVSTWEILSLPQFWWICCPQWNSWLCNTISSRRTTKWWQIHSLEPNITWNKSHLKHISEEFEPCYHQLMLLIPTLA